MAKPSPARSRRLAAPPRPRGRKVSPRANQAGASARSRGHWLAAAAAMLTFAAGLMLDTGAVIRLAWACLVGELGLWPRLAVALLLTAPVIVLWFGRRPCAPPAAARPARRRRRASGTKPGAAKPQKDGASPSPGTS